MTAKISPIPAETAGLARYAALANALQSRLVQGEWPAGCALPSEQTLASEHQVALGTMRRALQLLEERGLVDRIHGKGTFVRHGLAGATMLRFFRFGQNHGEVPASTILSRKTTTANAEVAAALQIPVKSDVLAIQRLRAYDGEPCLLEEIWLPLDRFEALRDLDPSQWAVLLYPFYYETAGIQVMRAVDQISFAALTAQQARRLNLPAGHPCAVVRRVATDIQGSIVEFRISRGDAYAFTYSATIT
ncbi:GntR family transcriptional regulator [Pigmentiphaga soli]|uniref:GntR family transcriptional regulator n=1 Tax=Pigmentiphaga soli TaxID=1007095 RepID=A0ABP8GD36_9BURK